MRHARLFCDRLPNQGLDVVGQLLRYLAPRFDELPRVSSSALLARSLVLQGDLGAELLGVVNRLEKRAW
jgi:hypothetical protein